MNDYPDPREALIRELMTAGGCFVPPGVLPERWKQGRSPDHEGRVAALCLAWDLLNGAPVPTVEVTAQLRTRLKMKR
jgi:hypothetical protein